MTKPEIKVFFYEDFPTNLIDEFVETTKGDGYEIVLDKRKRQFSNFIGELLPTIAIFLTTSFLAGFLNKAGSDTYDKLVVSIPKLKKSVSQLIEKIKDLKAYIIRSHKEAEPTNCNLSFVLQLDEKIFLEFLFTGKTDLETLKESSETLFRMITDKDFKSLLEKLISEIQPDEKGQTIHFRFDEKEKRWKIYDPVEERFKRLSELVKDIEE